MNLEQLEQRYWKDQEQLQTIAEAYGFSIKQLTDNIENCDQHIQEEIAAILFEQIDLLQRILSSKRAVLSSAPVVSLTSYRALIS